MYKVTLIKFFLLTYWVCFQPGTLAKGQMERFHGGQCRLGHDDVILYDTIYEDCLDQCRARTSCTSISVHSAGKICRLHLETSGTTAPQLCPGYVFSKKDSWLRKENPGCENACSNGTVCAVGTDGQPTCLYKECPVLTNFIQNGTVYGNAIRVGSRSLCVCDEKFKVRNGIAMSTCGINGDWSGGPSPTCVQNEFYLPSRPLQPDYTVVDLFANDISLVDQTWITFKVRANNDVHVMLAPYTNYTNDDVVEIVLGGWSNSINVIRLGISSSRIDDLNLERNLLSGTNFRDFWISTSAAPCIQVGKGAIEGNDQLLEWCGFTLPVNYIYIGAGYGSDADFVFP